MRLIIALCLFLSLLAASCTTSQLDSSEVFLQETISNVNLFQLVAEEEASDEEVISTIEAFCSAGISVDRDYDRNTGETALARAVSDGRIEVVKALLEAGARPEGLERDWSPLFSAVFYGYADIVEVLLEYHANPNAKAPLLFENGYNTPLNIACNRMYQMPAEARIQIVELLLSAGADPNAVGEGGNTPLMNSLSVSTPTDIPSEIPILLIKYGADVNYVNDHGWTPFLYAATNNVDEGLVWVLIEAGADIHKKTEASGGVLATLAKYKSLDMVKYFVTEGFDPNERNILGFNLLHAICDSDKNCTVDGTRYALSLGLDVNSRTDWGWTPLSLAASQTDDVGVIECLLNAGAVINVADNDGITPVMSALAHNSNIQISRYLISNGADLVNATFRGEVSAFTYICGVGEYNDNISLLLDMGFDINEQSSTGTTPLMYACNTFMPEPGRIRFLLENGADPTLHDSQFKTALDYARANSQIYNTDEYWLLNDAYYNHNLQESDTLVNSIEESPVSDAPASEKRLVEFDSIGISFELPEGPVGMISTDEEIISGVTKDGALPILEMNDSEALCYITVTASYMPSETYIYLDESWVNNLFDMLDIDEYYDAIGLDFQRSSVFDDGLVDFIKLQFAGEGYYAGMYVSEYQTVINKYSLTFTVFSGNQQQGEKALEELLASIALSGYGELPKCYSPVIRMETNGLTIDCPEGYSWERSLLLDSVAIHSNSPEADKTLLTCSVTDLYESLSPVDKMATSRRSLDYPDKEILAEAIQVDPDSISSEIVGEDLWYRTTLVDDGDVVYFRIRDGYHEVFSCRATSEQEALLREILETIRYE